MKKLCIVHFQELEKYPPAINLLQYLQHSTAELNIVVLTTWSANLSPISIPGIRIFRLAKWGTGTHKISRMFLYLRFNVLALLQLIRFAPQSILFYETLSAWAPWFYKKFIRRATEIYIHYHEYVSPAEYERGMKLSKWMHEKEKQLLPGSVWVSHTNDDRLKLFLEDVADQRPKFTYIIPNYPPSWWKSNPVQKTDDRVGFVYVGALSLETMYLREMAEYVKSRWNECYWDIYSTNVSRDVMAFFKAREGSNIVFKGGIAYEDLPKILPKYHIGLILYKGHIPNYVYNIPNKLFEYHVSSLDVWFPVSMKSSLGLVTTGSYPKICAVDFENLQAIDLKQAASRSGLKSVQHDFCYEPVFKLLYEKLIKPDEITSTKQRGIGVDSQGNA